MTIKKLSELRIKLGKRKPAQIKNKALKEQSWYAEAAKNVSIVRDGQRSRRSEAGDR